MWHLVECEFTAAPPALRAHMPRSRPRSGHQLLAGLVSTGGAAYHAMGAPLPYLNLTRGEPWAETWAVMHFPDDAAKRQVFRWNGERARSASFEGETVFTERQVMAATVAPFGGAGRCDREALRDAVHDTTR